MKKLQQAIRDLTDTQQELNKFLVEVQVNLMDHAKECCGINDKICRYCDESWRLHAVIKAMLNDD